MKILTKALLFSFLFFLSSYSYSQTNFIGSFKTALSEAKELDKPILVDAYTTWCKPCKMMDAEAFSDSEIGNYLNETFVNVKLDMDIERSFANKYNVVAYPTVLFLNKEGEEITRLRGYGGKEFFKNQIYAIDFEGHFDLENRKLYVEGLSDEEFEAYIEEMFQENYLENMNLLANHFILTKGNLNSDFRMNLVKSMLPNVDNKILNLFISQYDFNKDSEKDFLEKIIFAIQKANQSSLNDAIISIKLMNLDEEELFLDYIDALYEYRKGLLTKDGANKFYELFLIYPDIANQQLLDAGMNQIVTKINSKKKIEKLLTVFEKMVDESEKVNAIYYDKLSLLYYKLGYNDKAIQFIKKMNELLGENTIITKPTLAFLKSEIKQLNNANNKRSY